MKEAASLGIKLNFSWRLSANEFIIYSTWDWKPIYVLTAQSHIAPPKFLPNTFIYEVLEVFFFFQYSFWFYAEQVCAYNYETDSWQGTDFHLELQVNYLYLN